MIYRRHNGPVPANRILKTKGGIYFETVNHISRKGLRVSSCLERECFRFRDMGRFEDSLVRGFGGVVVFDGFGADPFFCEEFDGGGEEVMEESPFVGIEVIEEGDDFGVI